jgi:hypothetical protein
MRAKLEVYSPIFFFPSPICDNRQTYADGELYFVVDPLKNGHQRLEADLVRQYLEQPGDISRAGGEHVAAVEHDATRRERLVRAEPTSSLGQQQQHGGQQAAVARQRLPARVQHALQQLLCKPVHDLRYFGVGYYVQRGQDAFQRGLRQAEGVVFQQVPQVLDATSL